MTNPTDRNIFNLLAREISVQLDLEKNIMMSTSLENKNKNVQSTQPFDTAPPDLHLLLPKCLQMINNDVKSAELRAVYDAPTNQTTFHYSLVFEGVGPDAEEKYRVAVTEAQKMMIAMKAKKLNQTKEGAQNSKKNEQCEQKQSKQHTNETLGEEQPFPPDLSSHSENKKSEAPSDSASDSASASASSSTSSSCSRRNKKAIRSRKSSTRLSRNRRKNLKSIGCLDDLEPVCVKVVIIDTPNFLGKLKPISCIKCTMSTLVKTILTSVVGENCKDVPLAQFLESSSVYFAFVDKHGAQKLRRIRSSDVRNLNMSNLPTLRGSVVLILDLVGHVQKGKKIHIQINIEQDI